MRDEPNLSKFDEPTIVGVDFPNVALREGRWDVGRGELRVRAVAKNASLRGAPTQFRVTNVSEPSAWTLRAEGAEAVQLGSAAGDVLVEIPADGRAYTITRG